MNPDVRRVAVLDALRGFAAVGVALVHFTVNMKPTWFQQVCHWGWLGVDVFFVISGFVIPFTLSRGGYHFSSDYPRFLGKRIARLHPPYIAAVLVLMGIGMITASLPLSEIPGTFISHALFLNGITGKPWLSNVFWSLAIEMQFYLFIGVVAPLLMVSRTRSSITFLLLLLIAFSPIPKVWLPPHLPLFCFGIAAFLKCNGTITTRDLFTGILLAGTACTMTLGKPQALAGGATALVICYNRWTIPRPLVNFGAISYSLYLLHPILAESILPLCGGLKQTGVFMQMIIVGFTLAISIAAAWVWFRLLEKPSQTLSSSIRYRLTPGPGLTGKS